MRARVSQIFRSECLFVDVIEPRKLPACSGPFEVIDHDFVSTRIGTRDAIVLRIFSVCLGFGLSKTSYRITLFVEELLVTFRELRLGPNAWNAV